jgi:hypothetical protein
MTEFRSPQKCQKAETQHIRTGAAQDDIRMTLPFGFRCGACRSITRFAL